tara:strand:- start:35 stop:628 length:594 start_codon:yes stop_codon:yes gene_type:complete
MNVGGWKHGKFIKIPDEKNLVNTVDENTKNNINVPETINLFKINKVKFILMIKNPYMWINSMCKHENKSVENSSFIIKQIKIWNTLYTNYKQYIESGEAYLIKYEKLIQEPDSVLENLIKEFNLKRKFKNSFKLEKKKLHPNSDYNIGMHTNKDFDKTKYINPNINKILTNNIIKIINNNIDFKLMDFYGYDIIYDN